MLSKNQEQVIKMPNQLTEDEKEELTNFYKMLTTLDKNIIREEDEPRWVHAAQILSDKDPSDYMKVVGCPMISECLKNRHTDNFLKKLKTMLKPHKDLLSI